jgi:hypothetical protein
VSARLQLVVARHYLFCCQRSFPLPLNDSHIERQEATLLLFVAEALVSVFRGYFLDALPFRKVTPFCSLSYFFSPLSVVGLGRLELPTSPLSGVRSNHLSYRPKSLGRQAGGAGRDRTGDLLNANQALSQLSYSPFSREKKEMLSRPIGRQVSSDQQRTPEITVRTVSSGDPEARATSDRNQKGC